MPRNNSDRNNYGRDSRDDSRRNSNKEKTKDRNSLDGFESEIDGQIEPEKSQEKKEG